MNLSEEDPLPKSVRDPRTATIFLSPCSVVGPGSVRGSLKSVMTTLRRYRKPVAEMPNNPDHDSNERKEIENSGSRFTLRDTKVR